MGCKDVNQCRPLLESTLMLTFSLALTFDVSVTDLRGGAPGTRPQRTKIFAISSGFGKFWQNLRLPPPQGLRLLLCRILDPPLGVIGC